ncbi:MAG: hypothetical protein OIN89_02115 [Candidatus Methanoperedens sp.]|jgi:hypothetical protein|nr:hypothetical protein [Candidatus Methanoperedens sp.]PKL54390.1 MAG: hypothetical protein CVV36_02065 [Candidatus Methanoperedenaceae archaeon HGW-Methanoperedenaceae-1]
MNENIKISRKDKQLFDMLQAELTLKTGKKMTQHDLFSKIIEFTRSRKENFFGDISSLPLSENKIKRIKSLQCDWEVITKEKDIDTTLYGVGK